MVLYTVKIILPIKDILKTLPSTGFNNYIKIFQRLHSRKKRWSNSAKWNKVK